MKKYTLFTVFIIVVLLSIFVLSDIVVQKNTNDWYAVKLADGKTYYGHIESLNENVLVLSDAYSVELMDAPIVSQSQNFQIQTEQKKIYNLIHRSDDPTYKTDNRMSINIQAIMFWEKIGDNSQIVQLIEKSKQQR